MRSQTGLEKIELTISTEGLLLSAATVGLQMLVDDLSLIRPSVKQDNAAILFPG